MSFDDAERSEPTQALDLGEDDVKDESLVPLRYVKFQNVQSVTVTQQEGAGCELGSSWLPCVTNTIDYSVVME